MEAQNPTLTHPAEEDLSGASFSEEDLISAGFNRDQVLFLMKEDLNAFAGIVIPNTFTVLFPDVHQQIWKILALATQKSHDFSKIALGLPRGHAKTTLIKLFVCYCVLFTRRNFVLIVGSAARLAEGVLSDIMAMLRGENTQRIFGGFIMSKDTEAVKRFAFGGRNIVLAALGAGSSIRGLNLDNDRPDVMICDDIQSAEDKDNKETADKLLKWMLGTLFKAKSPTGCLYIYIGNMFSGPNCILAKLRKSKHWISFVVGALLANGSSIWPALHSPEDLIADLESDMDLGHPEIWMAEVQNDPDSIITARFNVAKVPAYPFDEADLVTAGAVIIDLSGTKENSDDGAIGYFCTIEGRQIMRAIEVGKWSPYETIERALKMCFQFGCPFLFIEATAYQASFKFWFDFICTQKGITGFQMYEIYPGSKKKQARILRFLAQLLDGSILLHPSIRAEVLHQASQFNAAIRDNKDDILDLGAYHDPVWTDYGPMLATAITDILEDFKTGERTVESACSI